MKKFNKYIAMSVFLSGLISAVTTSCTDDYNDTNVVDEVEGKDTRISIHLTVPDFSKRVSRADMTNDDANNVQSLWIGIYRSSNGQSTLFSDSKNGLFLDETDKLHGFIPGTKNHQRHTLKDIETKSGLSYIVAVANPDRNTGYKMDDKGVLGPETNLLTLLQNASSWEEFQSIVIEREPFQNAANLELPNATVNPLPMSGIYVGSEYQDHDKNTFDWTNIKPTHIPMGASSTLEGSIHLRRPFTQVKFNISAAEYDGTGTQIINIEPESYTVYNVPTYSWLYERSQKGDTPTTVTGYANAGDAMQTDVSKNTNYLTSLNYASTYFKTDHDTGVTSFDFWQMENKRTGVESCNDYQKRELEYKEGNANSGVYQSLCPTSTETLNNKATFVEIRARITYRQKDPVPNPDDPNISIGDDIDSDLPGKVEDRTVEAVYRVHLGYVGNNSRDFNNYRNSIYTYNVKIKSANSIIVEALLDREEQPGAEGLVSDVTDKMFDLDSHYNAFNIQLTETELQNFSFSMRSYYGGDIHNYSTDRDGISTGDAIPARGSNDYKFFSWVEIVPTTGETVLAPYPGVDVGPTGGSFIKCNLNEIRQHAAQLWNASQGDNTNGHWFTVFVNEYTYEDETANPGVETGGNWRNYVMKPNRVAYLNVAQSISTDGQSSYFRSKFAISQRSIQTYYNYMDNSCSNAIGVEDYNETFGMNLRWPTGRVLLSGQNNTYYPAVSSDNLSADNGRYNVWIRSGGGNGKWDIAGDWTTYVNSGNAANNVYGTINKVNDINNTNQTGYLIGFDGAPKTWPVPQPVLLNASSFSGNGNSSTLSVSVFDPQTDRNTAQVIHAMHACMNRNRDNNGNGVIDADELRWYLPSSGKYTRVILGRNSLRSPILDYNANPELPFPASSGNNSRLLLATSDFRMIWAFQGLSISDFGTYGYSPWAVRCIRNLGVDMSSVTNNDRDDPIEPAYDDTDIDTQTGGGVIKVTHYYGTALRDYTGQPIAINKVNSNNNKIGQYGFEIAPRGNDPDATSYTPEADISFENDQYGANSYESNVTNATPCSNMNNNSGRTGWRIPNQKELVIMMRAGVFSDLAIQYCMSSTITTWNESTPALSTGSDILNHKVCCITQNANTRNFEATAQSINMISRVRCVRDLAPDEANKSYDEIRNNR